MPASLSSPLARVFTGWSGSEDAEIRQDHRQHRLVKADTSCDPGCLLSTGTLRRIRWPLQPRSRDRHTTFWAMGRPLDGTLAPPWVFVRTLPFSRELAGTPTLLSLAAPVDGFTHRRSLRARSPFTRSCRCFCSAITELIRDQTPPDDFCNCLRRAGNQTLRLPCPRADDGLDHLPFLTHHAISLAGAVMSGEPRDVHS